MCRVWGKFEQDKFVSNEQNSATQQVRIKGSSHILLLN